MRAFKIPKRFFQVDNFQNEGGTTDEIRNDFFFEKKVAQKSYRENSCRSHVTKNKAFNIKNMKTNLTKLITTPPQKIE